MQFSQAIRTLTSSGHETLGLRLANIESLLAAIFDGGVADLELGATLATLQSCPMTTDEFGAAARVMNARVQRLQTPSGPCRPLVFASQSPALRSVPNLLPMLALVLARKGIPVLIHGSLGGSSACNAACILRELGVVPSATIAKAQAGLDAQRIAFVPTGMLCPGLANIGAMQARLGLSNWARILSALIAPFRGTAVRVIGLADRTVHHAIETVCRGEEVDTLIFEGADDDAFVDPYCRPRMTAVVGSNPMLLFEAERCDLESRTNLPACNDIPACVSWTRQALAGEVTLPLPVVHQLACCLFLSGYAVDMNQAKAVAAVESGFSFVGSLRDRPGTQSKPGDLKSRHSHV